MLGTMMTNDRVVTRQQKTLNGLRRLVICSEDGIDLRNESGGCADFYDNT